MGDTRRSRRVRQRVASRYGSVVANVAFLSGLDSFRFVWPWKQCLLSSSGASTKSATQFRVRMAAVGEARREGVSWANVYGIESLELSRGSWPVCLPSFFLSGIFTRRRELLDCVFFSRLLQD